jgi:hypothetical protein
LLFVRVARIADSGLPMPDFGEALVREADEKKSFAVILPKRELEQSAFVAFLPKNGLHRASRRLAGRPGSTGRRAIQ